MTASKEPGDNIHPRTVASFADEWSRFNQTPVDDAELRAIFAKYFRIFPWQALPENACGFDMGCGSGRWARLVAERVGTLTLVDVDEKTLGVARRNLDGIENVKFVLGSADRNSLQRNSQDFGYSIGVLHHVPDTAAALSSCVACLKPGAPFLLYLYYRFDNRPGWFFWLWRGSEAIRYVISRMPAKTRHLATDLIAILVYWPLARLALLGEKLGMNTDNFPLRSYRRYSLYTMRTDSRDRFGTPLEQRFTKGEIQAMMQSAGLTNIVFSDSEPFWCAVGYKA